MEEQAGKFSSAYFDSLLQEHDPWMGTSPLFPYPQMRSDQQAETAQMGRDEVQPNDSISQASSKSSSSVRNSLMETAARKAELQAKLECLKRKQALEREEQELIRRKEQLAVESELAAAAARAAAIQQFDEQSVPKQEFVAPVFSHTAHESRAVNAEHAQEQTGNRSTSQHNNWMELQRQQNQLTHLLLECHMKSALPQRSMQIFDGNPLHYHAFAKGFEQVIESKTADDSDKLYYLDQYTRGKANELVKSCMYGDDPIQAFRKAKMLLERKFGNKHLVLDALMTKAAAWPNIKGEDAEGLQSYSLFVTELSNLAKDLQLQSETNHSQNLKMVISKLPFKLRDKWRAYIDGIQENRAEPLSFEDAVSFISKQARIMNNPVYGNIGGSPRSGETQNRTRPIGQKQGFNINRKRNEETKCFFCGKENHSTADCKILERKTHQEKVTFCMSKGLCFACLQHSHLAKDCAHRLTCKICQRWHPTVLHRDKAQGRTPPNQDKEKVETEKQQANEEKGTQGNETIKEGQAKRAETETENSTAKRTLTNHALLQDSQPAIIPVTVRSKETGKSVHTYAFIDNGSNATFCTKELKEKLHAKGKSRNIHLQTLTDDKQLKTCALQCLEVADCKESVYLPIPEVFVQPIPIDKEDIPKRSDIEKWQYLREIDFHEIDTEVGLLIGNNVPKAMEPLQVINSQNEGPFACRSIIGWMVFGCTKPEGSKSKISTHKVQVLEDIQLQLNNLYNTEFSERLTDDKIEGSKEDKRFMMKVEESIKLLDGHFQIGLPFKGDAYLPNNRPVAEQRLNYLRKRFQKQPDFYKKYKECMELSLKKGYMERAPEKDSEETRGKIWYLPHHGVVHPQKDKLRVVYDCSAKYQGTSLNQELLKGPDLANNLVGVLTRFREGKVALMADIEGMFSQIRVPDSDKDFLRLLWWENGDLEKTLKEYRMTVHVFGAVSSPSCANYALKKTADQQKEDFPGEVIEAIHRNFYVDDCLVSTTTVPQATKLAQDLTLACENRGFHLTKWTSNKKEVLEKIPAEERAKAVKDMNFDEGKLPTERALGMLWHTEDDQFGFKIQLKDKPPTRRGILSTVCSLFDPLGCASPVLLPAKQLLQTLCRFELGWDEAIPPDLLRTWETWKRELPGLSEFKLSRCLKPEGFESTKSVTLHHFSDASEKGYGTVSYLRMVNQQDKVKCTFLLSKSRVAPLKQISIPRMELTAATVAVRIDRMIKQELDIPIDETYFWTDSTSVLRYIQSETGKFKTFVANRIALIQDGSQPNQWHYVESSQNPADVCSRGIKVDRFLAMGSWKEGPEFLQWEEDRWPELPKDLSSGHGDDPEVKKKTFVLNANVNDETSNRDGDNKIEDMPGKPADDQDPLSRLIEHYSDWNRLKRAVAWLQRLKDLLKYKGGFHEKPPKLLTIADMKRAEETILRYVQHRAFAEEIKVLRGQSENVPSNERKKTWIKKSSPIYKLDPRLDKGLLRVGGRLRRAALPMEVKNPVIVPKGSHVAELILRDIHENSGHFGRNFVMAAFQQKFYMTGVNSAIRKMVRKCVQCRKQRENALQQRMADLPEDRLVPNEPPFTRVGMDYFGPIEVKRGRSIVKRYGVLFTCLAIRAVHIEKADSLDTDSCISAIRRFVARRGAVKEMRSDNGTNLVGAKRELKKELESWNQVQMNNEMLQKGINWNFNPPGGSHHGGIWERQIRTVRQLLFSLAKQQSLSDESLETLFCEVEAIINSRPITRVSDDINDLEALTPNHLLLMKSTPLLPPSVTTKTDVYSRRRWKQVQYLADVFWRRWLREYIPQLQERQKWVRPRKNLQVGDVVLVIDDTAPRNSWMMGRIQRTMPDKEGYVRRAEVKTRTGSYLRPISKLCIILEGDSP